MLYPNAVQDIEAAGGYIFDIENLEYDWESY